MCHLVDVRGEELGNLWLWYVVEVPRVASQGCVGLQSNCRFPNLARNSVLPCRFYSLVGYFMLSFYVMFSFIHKFAKMFFLGCVTYLWVKGRVTQPRKSLLANIC